MDIHHLVKMASQIGQFFEAEPDQAQGKKDIASHLKRFWEPRPRKAIVTYAETDGQELKGIVSEAIQQHRTLLV